MPSRTANWWEHKYDAMMILNKMGYSPSSADEIRQLTRMEWDAAAPGWKRYGKDLFSAMRPVSDQLIKSAGITSGQTVLDVATGAGEPALTIARIVGPYGKVTAVDLSPKMLEIARERAASQGLTNVSFEYAENESLSMFQDNTFDSVVCQNGLMLMPDPANALRAFLRVLKPGGKASVTVWGSPEKAPVMITFYRTTSKHLYDIKMPPPGTPGGPFGIPSVNMLGDYFLKAGFSDFDARPIEFTLAQANTPEELWQAMTEVSGSLVIQLSKLQDQKKQEIKNDAMHSLRELFPSAGSLKFSGELILGSGTKPQ
jgi:SAM-dependent methyltransferase